MLCRNGEAVTLSNDHKPYDDEEKTRIEAAGSTVKFNRVNGDLAVSRALGDFVYKRCDRVPPERQAVTAFPEARPPPPVASCLHSCLATRTVFVSPPIHQMAK